MQRKEINDLMITDSLELGAVVPLYDGFGLDGFLEGTYNAIDFERNAAHPQKAKIILNPPLKDCYYNLALSLLIV